MANEVKMELEGIENLIDEVEKLGKQGSKIENKALKGAGEVVKDSIVREVPVRTGKLKKSISVSGIKREGGEPYVQVGPGKDGWYGKFVEFGTVKMKAKPFMEPGYENSKDAALDTIQEELKRGLGL